MATPDQASQSPAANQYRVSTEEISTNFYWTFGEKEIFNLQTTIRGNPTGQDIEASLRSVMAGMKEIIRLGGHAKQIGQQGATPPAAAKRDAAPEAEAPVAAPAAPGAVESETEYPAARNTLFAAKMQVKPREDDRADLIFFAAGHKYGDLYFTNRTIEDCIKLLNDVGQYKAEDLLKTITYNVNYEVEWIESEKLNAKNHPYKDIVKVKPHK
jgi:hypothetical protein